MFACVCVLYGVMEQGNWQLTQMNEISFSKLASFCGVRQQWRQMRFSFAEKL